LVIKKKEISVSSKMSRRALGPTQPPIQGAAGLFSQHYSGQVMKLTSYLHLVLR